MPKTQCAPNCSGYSTTTKSDIQLLCIAIGCNALDSAVESGQTTNIRFSDMPETVRV